MSHAMTPDEELARSLPLPLAQLYRRAHNAKTAGDRHDHAFYLAEAALKLAACLRIGAAIQAGFEPGSPLARSLEALCLPSLGHWLGFLRDASEYLRRRPDAALLPLAGAHEALSRPEALPAVRAFAERAARGDPGENPPLAPEQARAAARQGILGFFGLMTTYRNVVFGHGGKRTAAYYEELGPLLLAAVEEVLRQDCLFGGLTLAVARLAPADEGRAVRLAWQGLRGPASLALAPQAAGPEPDPAEDAARTAAGRVSFVAPGVRVALHPLVVYQEDATERERVAFLNGVVIRRREGGDELEEVRRCTYLDYTTGEQLRGIDPRRELADLLARLRGRAAAESDVDRVIAASRAEDHPPEPAEALAPGGSICDFGLVGELGRGAMGVVYKARQRSLNRLVALKVLPPALAADPVALARFRREIAALARCEHPNLVKIFTSGNDGDRHYYAMELVDGANLADLFDVLAAWRRRSGRPLREGDLPAAVSSSSALAERRRQSATGAADGPPEAEADRLPELDRVEPGPPPEVSEGRTLYYRLGEMFAAAAEALAHLHDRGVIHRDLKPGNLMLTADGRRVVIMDLGLAQLRDRSQPLTRAGARWVGTLRYCAPEQLQWNLLDVDERADIYGLGATLYELVTLAPLFDGDTETRLIEQVLHSEPRAPQALDASVPRDLAAIIMGCLDKDRARRYASARDLADDLKRFRDGLPVRARPVTAAQRFWRWCRRNPAVAGLAAGVALALVAGIGVSSYFAFEASARARDALFEKGRADRKATEAAANAVRARSEADRANAQAIEAVNQTLFSRRNQYDAEVYQAWVAFELGQVDLATDLIARQEPERTGGRDLRGFEWYYLRRQMHAELRTLPGHPRTVSSVTFSPDGRQVLSGGWDGLVKVWDAATGRQIESYRHPARFARDATDRVFSVASHPTDGKVFASGGGDKTLRLWLLHSGKAVSLKGHSDVVRSVAFSLDGRRMASGDASGMIRIWTPDGASREFKGHTGPICSVAFSPDGRFLASASMDKTVRIWEVATGRVVHTLQNELLFARNQPLAFHPGGYILAVAGTREVALWELPDGKQVGALRHESPTARLSGRRDLSEVNVIFSMAFSPDGRFLALANSDKTVALHEFNPSPRPYGILKGHGAYVESVAFSPDGRRLVSSDARGSIKVWDLYCGDVEDSPWDVPASNPVAAAFDRDGGRLAVVDRPDPRSQGGELAVNDTVTGRVLLRVRDAHQGPTSVAFSPDGHRIATGGADATANLWEAASGRLLSSFRGHEGPVTSVAFSPDGRRLVTGGSDRTVRLWDVADAASIRSFRGHADQVTGVAFSPDGRRIASGSLDATVRIWDPDGRADPLTLKGHTVPVLSVAFGPEDRVASAGGFDVIGNLKGGEVKIWDAAAGKPLDSLPSQSRAVTQVVFSSDGQRLVTASRDGTFILWDAATRRELRPFGGAGFFALEGRVAALGADGKRLAINPGLPGSLRIFDCRPLTPDLGVEREAVGLVHFLHEKPLQRKDEIALIRADATITEAVRRKALELVERYPERSGAKAFDEASLRIIGLPFATPAVYRILLLQAQAASRLDPQNRDNLQVLGIAQYRCDRFAEAVATLTKYDETDRETARPSALACLAMAYYRSGNRGAAQQTLERLRTAARKDQWANNPLAQIYLRQAEGLIAGAAP
jgi:WD40 repeat protein/serine/threonine protein kinase